MLLNFVTVFSVRSGANRDGEESVIRGAKEEQSHQEKQEKVPQESCGLSGLWFLHVCASNLYPSYWFSCIKIQLFFYCRFIKKITVEVSTRKLPRKDNQPTVETSNVTVQDQFSELPTKGISGQQKFVHKESVKHIVKWLLFFVREGNTWFTAAGALHESWLHLTMSNSKEKLLADWTIDKVRHVHRAVIKCEQCLNLVCFLRVVRDEHFYCRKHCLGVMESRFLYLF